MEKKLANNPDFYKIYRTEERKEYERQYYQDNKEAKQIYSKTPEARESKRKYKQNRRHTDGIFRMRNNVSNRVNKALRINGKSKGGDSFFAAIGYTLEQLKEHIESQFDEKMTWENYGIYWHVDHIMPHSLFEYEDMECKAFRDCWALLNLRPLEAT